MNPQVDKYLIKGCMRCKYGGTPQCKVLNWVKELKLLRQIVLKTGLKEEIKWGVPVYTHKGKNVLTVNALRKSANIGFFKGALLTDRHHILQQQKNTQSARLIKFTHTDQIIKLKNILLSYILEAIQIEESKKTVKFKKKPEPIPDELSQAFENDAEFKKAFYALTPSKQRGYIIYFAQAKQSQTKISRIKKYKQQILDAIGLNDKYNR